MRMSRSSMVFTLFVAPALLFFTAFFLVPFFYSVFYSFQNWNGISQDYSFAGLQNYIRAVQDGGFVGRIGFTLLYTLAIVAGLNVVGLLLALAVNLPFKGRNLVKIVFFVPNVIGLVIVGCIWNFIFVKVVPAFGGITGIEALQKNWLALPDMAFWALVIVTVWQGAGYYIVMYLAGLQGVPRELYESASMDGMTGVRQFFNITLPLITPSIVICMFSSLMVGLKSFDLSYSLTMGGPFGTTRTIAFDIFLDAFNNNQLSYACAKSVIFTVIAATASILQTWALKRKEVEL